MSHNADDTREQLRLGLLLAIEKHKPFTIDLALALLDYVYEASRAMPTTRAIELVELLRRCADVVEQRYLLR
jgi:hypothetical protein